MSCPSQLTAGTTWQWGIVSDTYTPADGWAMQFVLIGGGQNTPLTVADNAANDGWTVTHTAADSVNRIAGRYEWFARVTKGADAFPLAQGYTDVLANPFAGGYTASDTRSFAAKTLEVVEALLGKRATSGMQEYEIAGRKAKFYTMEELLKLRSRLALEVKAEADAAAFCATGISKNRILTRFR